VTETVRTIEYEGYCLVSHNALILKFRVFSQNTTLQFNQSATCFSYSFVVTTRPMTHVKIKDAIVVRQTFRAKLFVMKIGESSFLEIFVNFLPYCSALTHTKRVHYL
jgi:hypothetical protein